MNSQKTILLVDDSETIREGLKEIFTRNGFQVFEAEDGAVALALLKDPSLPKMNIIITDLNMPKMNGMELLREFAKINTGKMPIIMLTTEFARSLKEEGKRLGVNAWMVKPYKENLVLEAVNALLKKMGSGFNNTPNAA